MSDIARLIAGGLFALIAVYIGVLIKRRYKNRVTFYKSVCDFSAMLATELSMKKTPIPEVTNKFLTGRNGEFEKALSNWLLATSEGRASDLNEIAGLLKLDERKVVADFLSGLGKTALDDQLAHIAHFSREFEQMKGRCEVESKKFGSMYFKLCALLGIAIMLMLA